MDAFTITPEVDETQEFIEIANDFANPLDLVREAISNSYDAKATEIKISFDVEQQSGERLLIAIDKDITPTTGSHFANNSGICPSSNFRY